MGTEPSASSRVGVKKNGYGMEMGSIVSSTSVPELVKSAFVQKLRAQGYKVSEGASTVDVSVARFYNDFKPGFFTADADADVTLATSVKTVDGRVLYERTVTGEGKLDGLLAMTPGYARQALEKALPDAVETFVNDPAFQKALSDTATSKTSS